MNILLVRHGETTWNREGRYQGRTDVPLNERGVERARKLGGWLRGFSFVRVFTSPLQRCVLTGAKIAAACGIKGEVRDGLHDIDYGAWQMRTHDEVSAESPEAYRQWRSAPQLTRFPKGESLQDVMARTSDVLREVLLRYPEQTVVLVGHDSVNRVLLLQLLDMPLAAYWRLVQDPCTLNEIDVLATGDVRVQRVNDTSHLDQL